MDETPPTIEAASSGRSLDYHDLLAAFALDGCAICRLVLASAARYLDAWAYETFTDRANREALIDAGGFCAQHTWALVEQGALFPLAVAYQPLLRTQRQALSAQQPASAGALWQRVRALMARDDATFPATSGEQQTAERRRVCPACRARADAAYRIITTFADAADDAHLLDAFSRSAGFCLPHADAILHATSERQPPTRVDRVAHIQQSCLDRAITLLGEYIRTHDYRFGDESSGAEALAWRLAAELVAGKRGVW